MDVVAPALFGFETTLDLEFGVEDDGAGDWGGFEGAVGWDELGLLMPRAREAGGPTGTTREPNSTPMVTS